MFEVFVKDFVFGTKVEIMTPEKYMNIIMYWAYGHDIEIDKCLIPNKRIESIYSRKVSQ